MMATHGSSLSVARWVLKWCTWYTRGLDPVVARDRQDEVASDIHEQRALAAEIGTPDWKVDSVTLRRAIAGAPADLSWRAERITDRMVDRPTHGANRRREMFAFLTFLAGVSLAGFGGYLYFRIVRALTMDVITYLPKAVFPIIALTLAALLGCSLFIPPATRGWASLILILPSLWLPGAAVNLLYTISATASGIVGSNPERWHSYAYVITTALVALFAASALWRLTLHRRKTRYRIEGITN